jgi:DNA-binding CsgD family transcriptional regulator
MSQLGARDYEHMVDLAVSALNSHSSTEPWEHITDELVRALRGTVGFFSEVHWKRGFGRVLACTPASLAVLSLDSVVDQHIKNGHPLPRHYAITGDQTPMAVTDIVDRAQWRRTESYLIMRRKFDSRNHFAVPLPSTPGSCRCFVVHRASGMFTDHDRAYTQRIQPLLASMDAHFRLLSRWQAGPLARSDAATTHKLSPREMAVLILLAEAQTAQSIGRRLGIATRTVHKHLQNIYRKLGTYDRLETVLRAGQLGLLDADKQACAT